MGLGGSVAPALGPLAFFNFAAAICSAIVIGAPPGGGGGGGGPPPGGGGAPIGAGGGGGGGGPPPGGGGGGAPPPVQPAGNPVIANPNDVVGTYKSITIHGYKTFGLTKKSGFEEITSFKITPQGI